MPKMKTNRGARKRFKALPSGKVVRAHSHHRHILTKNHRQENVICDIPHWHTLQMCVR